MASGVGRALKQWKRIATRKGYFDKNPGGGKDARKMKKGGRAGYNTGGGADQTTREKLKFHLDKQISKLKKGIDKKRPTKSEYEDLRARTRRDRKRIKHNIGGRANLLEEMGRLDAEKMNPNRRAEKSRVIGELNKGYKSGGRASYNSGGPIKVRDINKDGKKEGWEVARAKGMAKGMGKRLKMNSGGAVLKGKKVGCQIK